MRTRESDSTVATLIPNEIVPGPRSYLLNTVYWPSSAPTALNEGEYSRIDDVVGDFGSENPCYHFVTSSKSYPAQPFRLERVGDGILGTVLSGTIGGPGGYASLDYFWSQYYGVPINHPTTAAAAEREYIPDYSAEAWRSIYPVIQESFKAANSIYELKDFRRLPTLFRQTRRAMRSVGEVSDGLKWQSETARRGELRFIYDLMKPQSADTWSALLRMPRKRVVRLSIRDLLERAVTVGRILPAHFLNWKFALEPLMRDMAASSIAARSVARQLPRLLERADDSAQHTYWNRGIPTNQIGGVTEEAQDSEHWTGPNSQVFIRPWCSFTYGPEYTFAARYSYHYSPEARALAHELAMLDARGLHLSAANLWQATPWTFVVDWFVKVGDSLETLTPHHLEPVVNFHGATHSIKYEVTVGADCKVWPDSWKQYPLLFIGCEARTVATKTYSCYIRKSIIPSVSIPKTSDFSTLEKLLALALGLSSVRYSTV